MSMIQPGAVYPTAITMQKMIDDADFNTSGPIRWLAAPVLKPIEYLIARVKQKATPLTPPLPKGKPEGKYPMGEDVLSTAYATAHQREAARLIQQLTYRPIRFKNREKILRERGSIGYENSRWAEVAYGSLDEMCEVAGHETYALEMLSSRYGNRRFKGDHQMHEDEIIEGGRVRAREMKAYLTAMMN